MNYIEKLTLPNLPHDIADSLLEISRTLQHSESDRQWLSDYHEGKITVAGYAIPDVATAGGVNNTPMSDELVGALDAIYKKYFPNQTLYFVCNVMKNVVDSSSIFPPHCDRVRRTAINYVVDTGGDDVTTTFYEQVRLGDDFSKAANINYNDVTIAHREVLKEKTWYAFDTQRFHSVENITGSRFYLAILLGSNPGYSEFLQQYPELILKESPYGQ
jgi:hypothetical protein